MQKGIFKGRIPASAINIVVLGYTFSEPVVAQLKRAQSLGINLIGSPKAADVLAEEGVTVGRFNDKANFAGILKYPQAGLPTPVIDGISVTEPVDMKNLIAAGGKPIHMVFSEIDETSGVYSDGTMDKVAQGVHYNVTNAFERAAAAGRITGTDAKSLEQFLDVVEAQGAEGITAEVYEAMAIVNAPMTMRAVSTWTTNLADSMENFTGEAKAVLEEAGVLEEVGG